jgi:beta-galactosidase
MNPYLKKNVFILIVLATFMVQGQDLEKQAKSKIKNLEKLIKKAEKKGIDILKEKITIRNAEVFLKYANWDAQNVEKNSKAFKIVKKYAKDAEKMASELPDFERNDVVKMLDEAIAYTNLLLTKKVFRTPSPNVDWSKVSVKGNQLIYKQKPVFLADYTWKPDTKELNEYHGNQDGFFLTPSYVTKKDGSIHPGKMKALKEKTTGSLGFIFLNHKSTPKWAKSVYGEGFAMRKDTYTAYDIDHPGARVIQEKLLGATVPYMKGKNFSKLGYMLCNEPHFFTQKKGEKLAWASGPVSNFTIDKFKIWLKSKHTKISKLNTLWGTNFNSFNDVSIQIPIDISLKGSAKWYDWSLFNMYRVTEWYKFLKSEIQKYDPMAKVHLKIMPNLWTENARIHGIDLEALTDLSGIIGNDSGAENNHMWGKKEEWEDSYSFNWRELCMGFDFMKSVSPNKINYNTELHYLSTVKSRDLYLDPMYVRATFWLAHTYGMNASQIWYWPRNADGSISKKATNDKGYAGSNNHQPRVTNEVNSVMVDLNAFSEEITALQNVKKPLRLFYSKTSAINKQKHMDDVFELYEGLHFYGTSLGFVTKDILKKHNNKEWQAVLIAKTPFVTQDEFNALQSYLNNGGTVIMDEISFSKNEYGESLPSKLKSEKGILLVEKDMHSIEEKALKLLKERNVLSDVQVNETNAIGRKTCVWKTSKNKEGKNILSIVNLGKSDSKLNIQLKDGGNIVCKDLIKGISVSNTPVLKPYEVYFVEISQK